MRCACRLWWIFSWNFLSCADYEDSLKAGCKVWQRMGFTLPYQLDCYALLRKCEDLQGKAFKFRSWKPLLKPQRTFWEAAAFSNYLRKTLLSDVCAGFELIGRVFGYTFIYFVVRLQKQQCSPQRLGKEKRKRKSMSLVIRACQAPERPS